MGPWLAVGLVAAAGLELSLAASGVGAEGQVLDQQLQRFQAQHPEVRVRLRPAPDAADQRHQLFVQWLNAQGPEPDLLQVDVVWTAELAAAGWLLPLDVNGQDFFPAVLEANRWQGTLYALPWFVDAGMLYWRTDLVEHAPATWDELREMSTRLIRAGKVEHGLVWQGARYEGLITTYLEVLGGLGGRILGPDGRVEVADAPGVRALALLQSLLADGLSPRAVLTWQEEQARFAFQEGRAAFMRNWPYAVPLLEGQDSRVAGRFSVAPMPVQGGRPTAALGGAQLAINARTQHREAALALAHFLVAPEQQRERARVAGQYPSRRSLYLDGSLEGVLPADALRVVEAAVPRPVTPVYSELSEQLQIHLHRALATGGDAHAILDAAAVGMDKVLQQMHPAPGREGPSAWWTLLLVLPLAWWAQRQWRAQVALLPGWKQGEAWHALGLVAPAVTLVAVLAVFPLAWTGWESLHRHDLRMPWLGITWVGFDNYVEVFRTPRFWSALGHTAFFTLTSVAAELVLGMGVALLLNRVVHGRGLLRTGMLLPWAVPTVMAGLMARFLMESSQARLADSAWAWLALIATDAWKSTPFVALLLLAALQGLDEALYECARLEGASAWQQFRRITLPLLRPTLVVVLLFRTLDALRVFDLVYVLTGGGPGTATEPLALYTSSALLQSLRFGYGSALAALVFLATFLVAVLFNPKGET